jgi:hypothetical protein
LGICTCFPAPLIHGARDKAILSREEKWSSSRIEVLAGSKSGKILEYQRISRKSARESLEVENMRMRTTAAKVW